MLHCVSVKGLLRLQKLFGLIVVVLVVWWLGCWEDEWKFCGSRLQWMKGDVINETGELSMLPHYFMGMNKKLFLGPVGAAAVPGCRRRRCRRRRCRRRRGVVVICSRLAVSRWWCFILCSDACVRRLLAWVFAAAEAFCLGNANAAVAASFREKAVAVYGPDKQPWRLS